MAARPTTAEESTCCLLVYGSLMHPAQWHSLLNATDGRPGPVEGPADNHEGPDQPRSGWPRSIRARPVMLAGFARDFQQRPTWRQGRDQACGVLRVRPSPADSINAVLVCGVPTSLLPALDERERGYVRRRVPAEQITPLPTADESSGGIGEAFLYVGRPEHCDPALTPNREYVKLCLCAAEQWGRAFVETFLATTDWGAAGEPRST